MEKIPKKLRPFLDQSQKYKYRLGALLAFLGIIIIPIPFPCLMSINSLIESSDEDEKRRVYKDQADAMATFVVESQNLTLERLSVDKEYYGKFEKSLEKDLGEVYKVPMLLELVIKYLRNQLVIMTQTEQLINIIRVLLHPENHETLRKEGIKLLMLWMREADSIVPETRQLFASCVPLSCFVEHETYLSLPQPPFPLVPHNEPPMFLTAAGSGPKEQALALFTEILNYITFDPDANAQSTSLLYQLLRVHYLELLYPSVFGGASKGETPLETPISDDLQRGDGFLAGCPPALQGILLRYFSAWNIQKIDLIPNYQQSIISSCSSTVPVATFILQEIIFNSPADLELVHEIISQCLDLPFGYKPIIRIAINVLRTWLFTARERRPIFLQGIPTHLPTKMLIEKEDIGEGDVLDWHVQRYIVMISKLFDGRPAQGFGQEQRDILKEGIFFLRGLAMKVFFIPNPSSWDCLLSTLLRIVETHLINVNKYSIITDVDMAEEFAQLMIETIFGVWIRSESTIARHWESLAQTLRQATRWSPVVEEWSKTVTMLTSVMCSTAFPHLEEPTTIINSDKRTYRSGIYESAHLSTIISGNSLISRSMFSAINIIVNTLPNPLLTTSNDAFLNWSNATWTKENIIFLWRNILRALGDINCIERPDIHEIAIRCLVQTFERLLFLREIQQSYVTRPLPPLYEFASTLLDVGDLPPRAYERSRCLAYSALCRMFTRHLDMAFPDEFYPRFYLSLLNGLSDKDDPVSAVIILSSSQIFSRSLPGVSILIPAYLKCIAGMLNNSLPLDRSGLLVPMMRIVANIAILPSIFTDLTVPRIEAPLPIMSAVPITLAGEIDLMGIKLQAKDFLHMIDLQDYARNDGPTHSTLLSATALLLYNELISHGNPKASLVDGYLAMLLDHLLPKDSPVSLSVLDQFVSLCQLYPLFKDRFGRERELLVLQRLIGTIHTLLTSQHAASEEDFPNIGTKQKDELVSRLIHLTLDWIMVLPHDWLSQQVSIREQLFAVLDEALRSEWVSSVPSRFRNQSRASLDRIDVVAQSDTEADEEQALGLISLCREAAEYALVHLSHHLFNFAPEYGPSMINSLLDDAIGEEQTTLHFALAESSILTVIQSATDKSQISVVVRNSAGRFCWEARTFWDMFQDRDLDLYNHLGGRPEFVMESGITVRKKADPYRVTPSAGLVTGYRRRPQTIPQFDHLTSDLERTDMLAQLLDYIEEEHPELALFEESQPSTANLDMGATCAHLTEIERGISIPYKDPSHGCSRIRPSKTGAPLGHLPYQGSRLFLAGLGFLNPLLLESSDPNGESEVPLKLLSSSSGMIRDLRGLDYRNARETIKIAILYVAAGVEDELSILKTDSSSCSPAYDDFLVSLGWRIDLGTHGGYTGGIEVGMQKEDRLLYYCTSSLECIYHEAPSLIYDEASDAKLIAKKRHINNDHVQIVWNDHYRDYRPVPRGDYANFIIVINPLPNSLYSVNIYRDAGMPTVGPLFDGCLLPQALLGPLVRATAINAHRATLAFLGRTPQHPMSSRAQDISRIVKRHAKGSYKLSEFMESVIFGDGISVADRTLSNPPIQEMDSLKI